MRTCRGARGGRGAASEAEAREAEAKRASEEVDSARGSLTHILPPLPPARPPSLPPPLPPLPPAPHHRARIFTLPSKPARTHSHRIHRKRGWHDDSGSDSDGSGTETQHNSPGPASLRAAYRKAFRRASERALTMPSSRTSKNQSSFTPSLPQGPSAFHLGDLLLLHIPALPPARIARLRPIPPLVSDGRSRPPWICSRDSS
ncbi:hypothetical protein NUW54_g5133 [Trametes sanguinea]|uniref:Uncharacterized protein n=1 Tax=Trametes sanguinea TaxID=158606 RepID=A0ACC1PXL9_9APHY|nr:hypothetical protein NUW54_g5133 [Trametes sanguinea]